MTGELLIRNMHVLWKIVELIETEDSIAVSVFADIFSLTNTESEANPKINLTSRLS